jgi:hypothetical protein
LEDIPAVAWNGGLGVGAAPPMDLPGLIQNGVIYGSSGFNGDGIGGEWKVILHNSGKTARNLTLSWDAFQGWWFRRQQKLPPIYYYAQWV